MKTRTTVILFLLAAGLFAFIHFYADRQTGTRARLAQNQYAVSFDRNDIDGITISRGDAPLVTLKHTGNTWRITDPVQDRADPALMDQLLTVLERIPQEGVIEPDPNSGDATRKNLRSFALTRPKMKIEFTGKKPPSPIYIGRETAVDGKIYLRQEDSETAYVVDAGVRTAINKSPDDFRDPRITDFSATQAARVLISTKDGEMELSKEGDDWNLLRPIKARADAFRVAELITRIVSARVSSFVGDDRGDLAAKGLSEPMGTISLFTADNKESAVIQLGAKGKDSAADGVFARYAARGSVYLLPQDFAAILDTPPNDLRDRHLARINPDIVDRITLRAGSAPRVVLDRCGENWSIAGGGEADAAEVTRLLDLLRTREVRDFVADTASDLAKYGLDNPVLRVGLSSYASENVPEAGAGEHPILSISFGKTEGNTVYLRLEDEPFVVSVDKSLLNSIPSDPIRWRTLQIFNTEPSAITAFSRTKGGNTLQFVRKHDGSWTSTPPNTNPVNAQSLVNTLAGLRTVRWLGRTAPEYGFDKPSATIRFEAGGKKHDLILGVIIDGMRTATTGDGGSFLVNLPDDSALMLPLVN